MKRRITEFVPAGINASTVKKSLTAGYVVTVLISFTVFIYKFTDELYELYYYSELGQLILNNDRFMKDYSDIRKNVFDVFIIFSVFLISYAVYNFLYHYQGSKSIYTMKRLKNRTELYRRCLAFPVMFILLSILSVIILNFLYFILYVLIVPEECILPSWKAMWRF